MSERIISAIPRGDGGRQPLSFVVHLEDSFGPQHNGGPQQLLTAQEAATLVGCHANTVYLAAQSGELRCRRIGRLRRFTVEDLDEWTRGQA